MKNLLFISLFFTVVAYSQNSFIVDKKGTKTIVRDDVINVILIDKRISYSLVGKTWEKYIKFDDLDYANVNGKLLKSINLNKSKKSQVYFVLGENNEKTLIARCITVTSSSPSGRMSYSSGQYEMYVIDKEENIIESFNFLYSDKKQVELKASVYALIKKHFSDCVKLMDLLDSVKVNDQILSIFNNTEYINCK
ncbi:hypothetical protein [Flavobacterium sp.]|uniref:hypothetical protein n=1 Tax=Flavobacterium sp. TaxID=239 RepID=UPI00262A7E25|nr:hypothetical protein [Flavobacterium sp.]